MRQFSAFIKKEILWATRNGKILILGMIFLLFGIMNPAIAKLTPWMLEVLSEDLAESGIVVGNITVDALASWTQFFKNMPIALIIFLIMFSNHLTDEYQKGTLINMLTKGMKRHSIIISKMFLSFTLWTIGYWISFYITYIYNAYFWNNSVAHNLIFAVFGFYLLGLWLVSVIYLASSVFSASSAVMLGAFGMFGASYLLGMISKLKAYVPTYLLSFGKLLIGEKAASDYFASMIIVLIVIVLNIALSVWAFNKKHIQ